MNGRMLISNQSKKASLVVHITSACVVTNHLENSGLTFALCTVSLVVPTAYAFGTTHRMWLIH